LNLWLKQLRRANEKDRQEAAITLEENIGPSGEAAVPVLIEALKERDVVLSSRAASALGKIGPAARAVAPALIATLQDKDRDFITRANAARALGQIRADVKTVVPVLLEALADKDRDVRTRAAEGLGHIGPAAREAIPALRQALQKARGDLFLAPTIVSALGRMGEPAVPALIDALQSNQEFVRETAAKALGEIGPQARGAVPSLIEMLKKDDWKDRQRACQTLGRIGREARPAVPALQEAVKDKNSEVRESAAWAFVRIDPDAAKRARVQDPPPHYHAVIGADGKDFNRDDSASAGGGEIGGRVVL
jgi:hypothetical protein